MEQNKRGGAHGADAPSTCCTRPPAPRPKRGNALLKTSFKALRRVSLCLWRWSTVSRRLARCLIGMVSTGEIRLVIGQARLRIPFTEPQRIAVDVGAGLTGFNPDPLHALDGTTLPARRERPPPALL